MARFSRFVLGGIIGAGLALMFAPKSGRELRRMLMGEGRPALPPPAEEMAPPPSPPAPPVDLQARIEETRHRIETELEDTLAPAAGEATAEEAEEERQAEAEVEEAQAEPEVEEAEVEEAAPAAAAPLAEEEFADLKAPATGEPTLGEAPPETAAAETAPAGPEPPGFDQEEMRRRIDETRARLKAKAFDAMMSGETFIPTEAEGREAKDEEAPQPGLEKEVEEKIDESFKEED